MLRIDSTREKVVGQLKKEEGNEEKDEQNCTEAQCLELETEDGQCSTSVQPIYKVG